MSGTASESIQRRASSRLLVALLVVASALVIAGPGAGAGQVLPADGVDRQPIRTGPVTTGFPIGYLGVVWDVQGAEGTTIVPADGPQPFGAVRFRAQGVWGAWTPFSPEGVQAPGQWGSSLVAAGGADAYEIRGVPAGAVDPVAVAIAATDDLPLPAWSPTSPSCLTRAEWGADESIRYTGGSETWPNVTAPAQVITIHHTATANGDPSPAATVRAIYRFHTLGREWGDIAYHYLIDNAGRLYEGRWSGTTSVPCGSGGDASDFGHDVDGNLVIAGHVYHRNQGNVGVALLGNFSYASPSSAARVTLEHIVSEAVTRHDLDAHGTVTHLDERWGNTSFVDTISGHNDWPGGAGDTTCPGTNLTRLLPRVRAVADAPACTGPPAVATLVPDAVVGHISMTIGADGLPIIAYRNETNGTLEVAHCESADCSVSSSATIDSDAGGGVTGRFTSTVIGPDGFPIIAYHSGGAGSLSVADCSAIDCATATLTVVDTMRESQTAMIPGPDGFPIIAYFHDRGLKVADCASADCSERVLNRVDSRAVAAEYSAMVAGPDGFPTIAYSAGPLGLRVADCATADCSGATISRIDGNASTASMVIGPDGFPVVAYVIGGTLKVADCASADCSSKVIGTVKTSPGPLHSSLVAGPDGFPIITYVSGDVLEMADCALADCSAALTVRLGSGTRQSGTAGVTGSDGIPAVAFAGDAGLGLARVTCGGLCDGKVPTMIGTTGDDLIEGTDGDDVILGLGGNDTILSLGGSDTVCGNQGADTLEGGPGSDVLLGNVGDDLVSGQGGSDRIDGNRGDDRLRGGPGDDTIDGGDGHDRVWAGNGDDEALGGSGDDHLRGGPGDDAMSGGSGGDRIRGGTGIDELKGDDGGDSLYGSAGNDILKAGRGDDRLFGGDGDDRLYGHAGTDRLRGQDGDDLVDGGPDRDRCSAETTVYRCEILV